MALIASGRLTGSGCRSIQASSAASWSGSMRTPIVLPRPVAGRPRFLASLFSCSVIAI